jgi:hypothetical protein
MTSHEGTSATKPPLFDGTNFSFWKVRMRTYLMALGADVWDVVETGYIKPVVLASKDDKLEFSFNAKGMNAILNGLAEAEFVKVMHLQTAKEMWDKLISSYEGNEKVKDAKFQTYRLKFEQLKMNDFVLMAMGDLDNEQLGGEMDDEEAVVDMEGELISALEEIDRLRCKKRKQKRLLMQFKINDKKPDEDFALLKVELEEAKKIEDILKQQLSEKKSKCEALEEEIVKTRKEMEKFKALYHQNLSSIKASEELTSILNQQRNPKLKAGLGYEEGSSSNHSSNTEPIKFVKSSNIDNSHSAETKKENQPPRRNERKSTRTESVDQRDYRHERNRPPQRRQFFQGTKVFSMVIVFSALTLVTKL